MKEIRHSTVAAVLTSKQFFTDLFVQLVINGVLNYIIDNAVRGRMLEDPASARDALATFSSKVSVDVAIFVIITAVLTFFSSAKITKRIKAGGALSQKSLAATPFGLVVGGAGRRSLATFVAAALVIPGALIVTALLSLCWVHKGADPLTGNVVCEAQTMGGSLFVLSLWKAVGCAAIFTLNYVAAHNDTLPELTEAPKSL